MQEMPCIAVAFVLHERKFEAVHREFCENLKKRFTCVSTPTLVSDGEVAIVKAFQTVFPTWHIVGCWNHILTDVEMWLKKHGGQLSDILVYKSHIRELLQCETDGEMNTKVGTLQQTWSESFREYFESKLRHRILQSYAGWLKAIGLKGNSVTTNMSESLNAVIKRFQQWKEQSPDLCLLSLYRLQLYYMSQVQRSLRGFGPYTPANVVLAAG
jgi:transposase-like protein